MDFIYKEENCILCPRECRINRSKNFGACFGDNRLRVSKIMNHKWEEPSISGTLGSLTVFFSGCSLGCIFCQNEEISRNPNGPVTTKDELKKIIYENKDKCHNINLVTGAHEVELLIPLLGELKEENFPLPIVWNTSSYEKWETLIKLDGLIDIYLADFKYYSKELSKKYSNAEDYPEIAKKAIEEMYRQTGPFVIKDDLFKRGIILRHLVMPGNTEDSLDVLEYCYDHYKNSIIYSIMMQYTPSKRVLNSPYEELHRKVTREEYERVLNFSLALGIENAFIQDIESSDDKYIPDFSKKGY